MRASKKEREFLAQESHKWTCDVCKRSNQEIAADYMLEVTSEAVKELESQNVLG